MAKKKKTRADPAPGQKRSVIGFWNDSSGKDLECRGYVSLSHSPESPLASIR